MSVTHGDALEKLRAVYLRQVAEEDEFRQAVRAALNQARNQISAGRDGDATSPAASPDVITQASVQEHREQLAAATAEINALQLELAQLREQLAVALTNAARADELIAERDHLRDQLADTYVCPSPTSEGPTKEFQAFDGSGHKKRMGRILVEAGLLRPDDLDAILNEQQAHPQRRFGKIAVEHGYANEELIARVLAAQLALPYVDLEREQRQGEVRNQLHEQLARQYQCFPLRVERHSLVAAMANPLDLIAIENIELATGYPLSPVVAAPGAVARMIEEHYRD